jgi:hypothetical protein
LAFFDLLFMLKTLTKFVCIKNVAGMRLLHNRDVFVSVGYFLVGWVISKLKGYNLTGQVKAARAAQCWFNKNNWKRPFCKISI